MLSQKISKELFWIFSIEDQGEKANRCAEVKNKIKIFDITLKLNTMVDHFKLEA